MNTSNVGDIPDYVAERIAALPKQKNTICQQCHHETHLPILWNDYWCENCGHHNFIDDRGTAEGIARLVLEWAGVDYESIGLAIGSPREIPKSVLERVTKEAGRNLRFVGLNREFKWQCQKCGRCCTEVTKHAHLARMGKHESARLLGELGGDRLPFNEEKKCCKFLTENGCEKYHLRPMFCRIFPLGSFGIERGNTRVRYIVSSGSPCPGIGKGRTWTVRQFLKENAVLHQFLPTKKPDWTVDES